MNTAPLENWRNIQNNVRVLGNAGVAGQQSGFASPPGTLAKYAQHVG